MDILKTKNMTKSFGGVVANKDLSLTIEEGKITAFIGPNGSGKTTFINVVTGVHPITSGEIFFQDMEISKYESNQISRLGIARTFQKIRLFDNLSVIENVLVARKPFYKSGPLSVVFNTKKFREEEKLNKEKALELLDLVGLRDKAYESPKGMAYGLRRCLEIARALALEPKLLFLDEPAAGMTRDEFKVIMDLMLVLRERGITTVLVEHTMDFIKAVADWVYVLNFGEIISKGSFDEIERDPVVLKAYLGEE
jgi:ABC-type branched-subunit amino acid transport system ATPase component